MTDSLFAYFCPYFVKEKSVVTTAHGGDECRGHELALGLPGKLMFAFAAMTHRKESV